jgi:hypothetical protein
MAENANHADWTDASSAGRLHAALNLGWSMAELRGRLRYGHCQPPGTVDYEVARDDHALPLDGEHSLTEELIATRVAVSVLAERFEVDMPPNGGGAKPSTLVKDRAVDLGRAFEEQRAAAPGTPLEPADHYPRQSPIGRAWSNVTEAIYRWDEQIQDRLSVSVELLSGYLLGRGLAETFWALNPDLASGQTPGTDTPRPSTWEFLLGQQRCDRLTKHLDRLETLLPPMSVSAVKAPLGRWTELAAHGKVRKHPDAPGVLHEQLQLWRDVLLGARNPISLVEGVSIPAGARQLSRVVQAFRLELTIATLSVVALAGAGYYLGANQTSSGWSVAITILGFFGVTAAGLLARAKTQGLALYVQLRKAFYDDVIAENAAILPAGAERQDRRMFRSIR